MAVTMPQGRIAGIRSDVWNGEHAQWLARQLNPSEPEQILDLAKAWSEKTTLSTVECLEYFLSLKRANEPPVSRVLAGEDLSLALEAIQAPPKSSGPQPRNRHERRAQAAKERRAQ